MADRIKGITVQIGGDTTGLSKALKDTNKEINSTKSQLKDVERLLKLDPKNTELLAQKQKLLNDAVGETKSKLDTLKEAEKQVQEQFKNGEVSEQQYNALKREIEATEIELKDLESQAKNTASGLNSIAETTEKVASASSKVADATKKMSLMATGALTAAAASSVNFEKSFAKVSTLLTDATEDWGAYKDAIIEGSNETGIAANDFAEAVYSAISAGVDEGKAIEFVTAEAKLAKGGFTEMGKAVDVVTTALNGYGLSAENATKINDILIATQNAGKTTVDELASSLGQVIPVASASNTTFEELAASYALLTKNGVSTAQSGTYLKSMLSELSKTGSTADKALRSMAGKGFAELKAEGKSVSDVLDMLNEYAAASNVTLKDMFGSTEAGSAALVLAKNSCSDLNEMLELMGESAGSTDSAFEKMSETSGASFAGSLNKLKNTAIELGDTMAPIISLLADLLQKVADAFSNLDDSQQIAIVTILAVVAAISPLASAIGAVSTAIGFLSSTVLPALGVALDFIAANPIVLLIAAIVALIVAIVQFQDEILGGLSSVDEFLQGVFVKDWSESLGIIGDLLNGFFNAFKGIWDGIKQIFGGIIDFIAGVFTGNWSQAWEGIKSIFKGIFDALVGIAKAPLNLIIGIINGLITGINFLVKGLNKIKFNIPDWVPGIGGKSFGFNIPEIGKIPYLAKGGVLSNGSAVVGEAGPEILTNVGGRSVVQPLSASGNTAGNLDSIVSTLNAYLPYLASGTQLVLDTGELVGATAPAMNREFGKIAIREAGR